MEAIKAFAGEDLRRARYFPEDDRYLLTRPDHVHHYQSGAVPSVPIAAAG